MYSHFYSIAQTGSFGTVLIVFDGDVALGKVNWRGVAQDKRELKGQVAEYGLRAKVQNFLYRLLFHPIKNTHIVLGPSEADATISVLSDTLQLTLDNKAADADVVLTK
jgi:hypothetical protein